MKEPVGEGIITDFEDLQNVLTEMMNHELKSGFQD